MPTVAMIASRNTKIECMRTGIYSNCNLTQLLLRLFRLLSRERPRQRGMHGSLFIRRVRRAPSPTCAESQLLFNHVAD
jgi:hypothetical protein